MSAGGVNIAILVGRATSDPATRVVKGGVSQAIFGMTTREVWVDKQTDEKREKAIHHRVVVYGPLVRASEKRVRRGSLVVGQGQIETSRWVGKDGSPSENWTTEIVGQGWSGRVTVLDFAGELARSTATSEADLGPTPLSVRRSSAKYGDGLDDAPDQESSKIDSNLPFLA